MTDRLIVFVGGDDCSLSHTLFGTAQLSSPLAPKAVNLHRRRRESRNLSLKIFPVIFQGFLLSVLLSALDGEMIKMKRVRQVYAMKDMLQETHFRSRSAVFSPLSTHISNACGPWNGISALLFPQN